MTELLMFNPKTLAQQFLNPHDRGAIDRLKSDGWIQNPTLVHMHNSTLNKDVNIQIQDRKTWENKGYYAEPTMIYHPTEATRMVSSEDAKKALTRGWYASPAFFPGNDVGKIKTLTLKEAS